MDIARMSLSTVNDIFFTVLEHNSPRVMLQRQAIDWVPISAREFYHDVVALVHAFGDWGIERGDRIAILSENRPEWAFTDFASALIGAVSVPVYPTLTAEQTAFILRDSGARIVVVSSEKQLQKVLSVVGQTPVEHVVVMDAVETAQAIHLRQLLHEASDERNLLLESRAREVHADDLATIIYTSGTTGTPKGVMLTHGNMASNIAASMEGFPHPPDSVSLSFLPLSHVTARHVDLSLLYRGVTLAYCPHMENLQQAIDEVRPTIFVAVPRVYQKIHGHVEHRARGVGAHQLYRWMLSVGREHRAEVLAGQVPRSWPWRIADQLLYSKIRAGMGGRAEYFISGGAPLGRDLAEWFAQVGIRIHEGYGLTETSPVIAVNTPSAHKIGTVGKPLSNVEVRIAEDGEILVRGPSVFKGYWQRPAETEAAFVDGWFKTGDIGSLDTDGFLSVTDRKKDLIKTSGGKFIAPQPIENALKHNALVGAAAVTGDRRKFPAVIVSPYFPLLEDWARNNNVPFASRPELVAHPKVQALYEGIVEDLNKKLARFEQLKRVLLVADEFTAEDGSLTPSLKLRRRIVEERYRREVDAMYEEAETAQQQA
jgi:long-chain acyl-CoA synthetase